MFAISPFRQGRSIVYSSFGHAVPLTGLAASRRCPIGMSQFRPVSTVPGQDMQQEYFRRQVWIKKESMDQYLSEALRTASKYIETTRLSSEEEEQYQRIHAWYKKEYRPQSSNLIPFIPLQAEGRTVEQAGGGDSLTNKEVACYLSEGLVGPTRIRSVTGEQLRAIARQFHNFHKNHNRNLGSVYSMLQHRCLFDLAMNREILSKVSSILGENIMLVNYTINEVASGMGKSTLETGGKVDSLNCHSDLSSGSQYHFEVGKNQLENLTLDNRCVQVWLSISGTDACNAPLYFFPRTHTWEITTPYTYIDNAKSNPKEIEHVLRLLSFAQGKAARRIGLYNIEYRNLLSGKYRALLPKIPRVEIHTNPGDCILFNAHLRHGSGMNLTSSPRLALTLRFNTALAEAGGMESAGSVMTMAQRRALGIKSDRRKPMIQLLGSRHHPNNLPIDLSHFFP